MISIKWESVWNAKRLDVPSLDKLNENLQQVYKECLISDIVKNNYCFSGETHVYGKGVPVFIENREVVAKYITINDAWARLMFSVWCVRSEKELQIWQFRKRCDLERVLEIRCPR